MIRTVFLDRDGIVNGVIPRGEVISSPRNKEEFKFKKDFLDFCALDLASLTFFIASNQPDISRGLLTSEDLQWMDNQIADKLPIKEFLYCKHDNEDHCDCRKPKPGLLLQAMNQHGLYASECIFIGDSYKDVLAGTAAGVKTVFLQTEYNDDSPCTPTFKVNNLIEFYNLVVSLNANNP